MGAREVSVRRFGFPTRVLENPVVDAVGTTAIEILRNNPDRVFSLAVNLSVNVVYASFDRSVSATRGIRLDSNGGWVSFSADEDGEATAYALFAVATGAASPIYVLEIEKSK